MLNFSLDALLMEGDKIFARCVRVSKCYIGESQFGST
jgi:hypothetical protein